MNLTCKVLPLLRFPFSLYSNHSSQEQIQLQCVLHFNHDFYCCLPLLSDDALMEFQHCILVCEV